MSELVIGRKPPDFTLPAGDGTTFRLRDQQGKKVVLYFYPQDQTPTCTQQACEFRDAGAAFAELGAIVVGISPDDAKSHAKFAEKQRLAFPLLADVDLKVCKKYGVWQLKKLYGREYMGVERSTFLIDEKGRLRKEWRKVRLKNHIEDIIQALKML
ncbi:thioredoxin-dependent thiol peroxidase [Paenibacillus sp.]|uniref:thioredoxin-dependent thiol peroxidase n=1 Tax=Paenibacillus sp. TaxID=58172 RepID=UPI002D4DC699|nr:thioredoxin-dependent thiol peroxidase [Paenibacillus sp.]HZG54975.1 thioredoxin-dependent thiol peroxidase [Paenibacillus sp.]